MKLLEQTVKHKERTGFTLMEVLIVVVIIGVLAALVIPRFVSTPEKAMVAEANQMLGSLIRAQNTRTDTGLAFLGGNPLSSANWQSLGMTQPTASKFTYACASPSCTAARTVNGTLSTVLFNRTTNAWTCSGAYTALANGGCST